MSLYKASLLLTGLACAVVAHAQTSTSGSMRGVVSSKKGDFLSGAKVVIRHRETGMTRTQIAGLLGDYDFPLLPIGPYEVTVSAKGMRDAKDANVRVSLGQTAFAHFDMDTAEASATVEVVEAATAIDTAQINNVSSIDQELVEGVPLVTRNFTDMARLAPGVVAGTGGNNPRLIVEGGRQIFNAIQIDGASNNSVFFGEQRGGAYTPFIFGADTIKALQVVTNGYDVQYGQAGATVNAITKNGTNQFTGSALYQVRRTNWTASPKPVPYDPNGTFNTKTNLSRFNDSNNINFNAGGPIVKDKLWYYLGVERFNKSITANPNPTPISTTPNSGMTQADLNRLLTSPLGRIVTNLNGYTFAQEFGDRGANPPHSYPMENTNTVYFGRVDWSMNDNHRFVLRVNFQDMKDTLQNTSINPNNAESNNLPTKVQSISWVVESNNVWNSELFTETRLQLAREERPMRGNAANMTPSLQLPSTTSNMSLGTKTSSPRESNELTTQLYSATTWNRGDWQVKVGLDYLKADEDNQFFQNNAGAWVFGTYSAAADWANGVLPNPALSTNDSVVYRGAVSPRMGRVQMWTRTLSFFGQAQYSGLLSKHLNLTVGLRSFKQDFSNNPAPNPNFKGLDQGFGGSTLDPRFAFSWDVTGNAKTVVRGGFGSFTSPTPLLLHSNTMTGNGQIITNYQFTLSRSNSGNLALFNSGTLSASQLITGTTLRKLSDAELATLAANPVFSAGSSATSLWDPNNELSQSKKLSLGAEHDLGKGLVLGINATYVKYENLQRFENINLGQVGGSVYNDGYTPGINVWNGARPNYATIAGRRVDFNKGSITPGNPSGGFSDVWLVKSDGWGHYRGVSMTAKKSWNEKTGLFANVTYSRAQDTGSFERGTYGSASTDFSSELGASLVPDVQNPESNYGYGDSDRTWVANLVGYFPVVWGIGASVRGVYQSGLPHGAYDSTDQNKDGMRIEFYPGHTRNDQRQPGYTQVDLRINRLWTVFRTIQIEGIIDVYNLFNKADYFVTTPAGYIVGNPAYGKLANVNKEKTRELQLGLRVKF